MVLKANSSIIGSLSNADELQKNGWYFVSSTSDSTDDIFTLDLRYLFGKTNSVDSQQLLLSIVPIVEDVTSNNTAEETNQGGGCLIATAAFGSEMAPQVQFLREIRDNTVLQTELGTSFMTGFNQLYYSFSPYIADYERENPAFKETVKLVLTPLLTSLTLLQYADINSESEMLGYGIGVILLNIGMYFVAPAVLVMKIRKLV
jgi:peptidyl-prolyl cis-trans isomerase B (cyclophilin B)